MRSRSIFCVRGFWRFSGGGRWIANLEISAGWRGGTMDVPSLAPEKPRYFRIDGWSQWDPWERGIMRAGALARAFTWRGGAATKRRSDWPQRSQKGQRAHQLVGAQSCCALIAFEGAARLRPQTTATLLRAPRAFSKIVRQSASIRRRQGFWRDKSSLAYARGFRICRPGR